MDDVDGFSYLIQYISIQFAQNPFPLDFHPKQLVCKYPKPYFHVIRVCPWIMKVYMYIYIYIYISHHIILNRCDIRIPTNYPKIDALHELGELQPQPYFSEETEFHRVGWHIFGTSSSMSCFMDCLRIWRNLWSIGYSFSLEIVMLGCISGQTQMNILGYVLYPNLCEMSCFCLAASVARFEFWLVLSAKFEAGLRAFAEPQTLTPRWFKVAGFAEAFQSILELSENMFFSPLGNPIRHRESTV